MTKVTRLTTVLKEYVEKLEVTKVGEIREEGIRIDARGDEGHDGGTYRS